MAARAPGTPYALLTKHFLRQFLENDLISPEADRSQLLAVVGALVVSLTLFISVFVASGYIGAFLTPGQAAVRSLDDKFFFLALAMIVTALVAASQWDVLSIDARDAAILEPLPVRAATIHRAKLSAVAILGAGVAIAVTALPSLVFPWLLVINFPQMSALALAAFMATHAIVSAAAAAFGYVSVIALRETMAAVLGPRWFKRASPWAQGALIVMLGSALLLLAPASDRTVQRGFEGWRAMSPPMAFLGAYELAAGGLVADLPRPQMTARQAASDRTTSMMYGERRGRFPELARRAAAGLGLTFLLAVVAYAWNARRLPSLVPIPPSSFRRRWRLGQRFANTLLVRDSAARAGFHFTLAALWRSNTHRLTLACAAAAGCAMAVVALSNADVQPDGAASARLLSMQPLLYGALLVGFRHVIRVPAELRANWGFQLAWRGRDRAFVAGVKRAAIVALALPAVILLLPFFAIVIGPRLAIMHATLGLAGALVLLEALMVSYDKIPFTCTYLPSESLKALAPLYGLGFLVGASMFAGMQHDALRQDGLVTTSVTLAVAFACLRLASIRRPRPREVDFDEAPATLQRLGLHG